MRFEDVISWIRKSQRRVRVLTCFHQPLTVRQLAQRADLVLVACSYVLWELAAHRLTVCLNGDARRSRVYWLTKAGLACRRRLLADRRARHEFPQVDWGLYGWVCHSHRSSVIKALHEPMRPATIKRRARQKDPGLRMSAGNVREVIKLYVRRGVVARLSVPDESHPKYRLTDVGMDLRELLLGAEAAMPATGASRMSEGGGVDARAG